MKTLFIVLTVFVLNYALANVEVRAGNDTWVKQCNDWQEQKPTKKYYEALNKDIDEMLKPIVEQKIRSDYPGKKFTKDEYNEKFQEEFSKQKNHYVFLGINKQITLKPIPRPEFCFLNDFFFKNMKYSANGELTNTSFEVGNTFLEDDEGNLILADDGEPTLPLTDLGNNTKLFSLEIEHKLSLFHLISAFNPDFGGLSFFNLKDITLSSKIAYSNKNIDDLEDDFGSTAKVEKGFKYLLNAKFVGCIDDLLNFKLGCYKNEFDTAGEDRKNLIKIAQDHAETKKKYKDTKKKLDDLNARVAALEKKK